MAWYLAAVQNRLHQGGFTYTPMTYHSYVSDLFDLEILHENLLWN